MTLKFWTAWKILVLHILAICRTSTAGIISAEGDHHQGHQYDDLHHHHYDPHVSVASSFMHFHGPVEGPDFEIKVPYVLHHTSDHNHLSHELEGQEHGEGEEEHHQHHEHHPEIGYAVDYVAHPKYEFSYGVEDHHTGDFHGQKETRDGSNVSGEYSVKEPGGGLRTVTYHADKDGFHAVVHTSGKNDHSGATYTPEAHHHHHHHHHQQEQHQHQVHQELQDEGHHAEATDHGHVLYDYATGYSTHGGHN